MPSPYTVANAHTSNRQVIQYVEMLVPMCSRTFGDAASGCNATGTPCWYTRNLESDCKSTAGGATYDYNPSAVSFLFVSSDSQVNYLPKFGSTYRSAMPLVKSINTAPSKIPSAGGMANIGKTTIRMIDGPYNTFNVGSRKDRSYESEQVGSFWPRFKAVNPFINGSTIKIHTAVISNDIIAQDSFDDPSKVATQTFIVESISAPDSNGEVTVTCKDPLGLTDALKEKLPRPSKGKLTSAITLPQDMLEPGETATTSFTVDIASDIGKQVQPKYVRINDEIMEISLSGTTYTIVARGQKGTTADEHDIDDSVQEVYYVESGYSVNTGTVDSPVYTTSASNHHVADVLYRVLLDSGIDSSYLDLSSWATELDAWRAEYLLVNYLTEPTPVSDIIRQIAEQCQINIHYDPFLAKIVVSAKRPVIGARPKLTTSEDIYNLKIKEREDLRLTTASVYTLPRDYTETEKKKHYRYRDVATETRYADLYGIAKDTDIKASWLSSTVLAAATSANLLNTRKHPPKEITFSMDIKNLRVYDGDQDNDDFINSITTGTQFDLEAPQFQNIDGSERSITFYCTSVDLVDHGQVKVTASQFAVSTGRVGEISNFASTFVYDSANSGQRDQYAWIAGDDLLIPTAGDPAYEII